MFETTRDKVNRMFSADSIKKIESHGLMVIDKKDFDTTMKLYEEMKNENRTMKIQIKQLEARLQQSQQSRLV